jgi:hypothetical protein
MQNLGNINTLSGASNDSNAKIVEPACDHNLPSDSEAKGSEPLPEVDQTNKSKVVETLEPPKVPETIEKDGEDEVGDLSDGDSVDEEIETLRSRYDDMKERIQLAPKRMKQYNQYTRIMEERLGLLEARCAAYDRKILKEEKLSAPPDPAPAPATPSSFSDPALGFKFWQDFTDPNYQSTNIIDVLIGDLEGPKREKVRQKQPSLSATKQEIEEPISSSGEATGMKSKPKETRDLSLEVAALKGKQLPERIRFNVPSIRRIFRKIFGSAPAWPETDNILLRPYKVFLRNADEMQDLMSEVSDAVDEMISQRTAAVKDEVQGSAQSDPDRISTQPPEQSDKTPHETQEAEEPGAISHAEWETILKKFDLMHCLECTSTMAKDWPTKSAMESSFQSIRDLLDNYLLPVHSRFRERRTDVAQFHDLWHVFQIGDLIMTRRDTQNQDEKSSGIEQGMRVLLTAGGRRVIHPTFPAPLLSSPKNIVLGKSDDAIAPLNGVNCFVIHAYLLDFDGVSWTPVTRQFVIAPYSGERKIADLDIYPIEYKKDAKDTRDAGDRLYKRGKKFYDLVTAKIAPYVDCSGLDLIKREEIDDKVVVDMKSYFDAHLNQCPSFNAPGPPDMSETSDCDQGLACNAIGTTREGSCYHRDTEIIVDQMSDLSTYQAYMEGKAEFHYRPFDKDAWVPDYSICNHRVFVYKLRSREWGKCRGISSLNRASN